MCRTLENQYEIRSPEFERLIKPDARLRLLGNGYLWAEGTVWVPAEYSKTKEGYLIWSDIPNDREMRWSESDGATVYRKPSDFSNGHTLDREGRLVTCEHGNRRVTRTEPDSSITNLVDNYEGKKLNSPNDVIVKSDGTIWFSDPPYGIIDDVEGHKADSELGANYVFRFWPEIEKLEIVSDEFIRPNGLCFSPDESIFYVSEYALDEPYDARAGIFAFDVAPDGALSNRRRFATPDKGKSDGFRADTEGNIWTSSGDGIQVFSPAGELIGKILTPATTGNCAFGGPNFSTLYIAGKDSAYSIEVAAVGVRLL